MKPRTIANTSLRRRPKPLSQYMVHAEIFVRLVSCSTDPVENAMALEALQRRLLDEHPNVSVDRVAAHAGPCDDIGLEAFGFPGYRLRELWRADHTGDDGIGLTLHASFVREGRTGVEVKRSVRKAELLGMMPMTPPYGYAIEKVRALRARAILIRPEPSKKRTREELAADCRAALERIVSDKAVIDLCMAILEGFYAAAYDGPGAGNSVSRATFQAVSSGA